MKVWPGHLFKPVQEVINHLFPTACLLCNCRLKGELLCFACEMDLPYLERTGETCQQCALTITGSAQFCGHCLSTPPAFCRSIIPFHYNFPIDGLIRTFKYRSNLTVGRALSKLLSTHIQHSYQHSQLTWPDILIPVPLHWTRRWQRGFNQADILGQDIAKQLAIPLHTGICRRVRPTPPQKGLSKRERQQNLRRSFTLTPSGIKMIEHKCVAILDDVVTTTATMRELSNVLIKNGAHEVHVWALARTPENQG